MLLHFHTDSSGTNIGFDASYTAEISEGYCLLIVQFDSLCQYACERAMKDTVLKYTLK